MHSTCLAQAQLCHPKIGYVDLSVIPLLDTLALNSPLVHLNGDNAYSPQIPDTQNYTVTSKVQFLQLQQCLSSKMQRTQSLTRPTTHAAITTFSTSHNSISSQYSQPFTSLAAPKANPIFHAANKNLFLKTHFDYRNLTTSSSSLYSSQRKHAYVTTYPR